jgi:halimadienyl-diphosphate synthase
MLYELAARRTLKLVKLPDRLIKRDVTVAFSSEMVGLDAQILLDIENLQEANGSVAYSPAATAFFALHIRPGDNDALDYLQQIVRGGGAPNNGPIDVFEMAWVLWNVALAYPSDPALTALCNPHLDALSRIWQPSRGVAACSGFSLIDSDDTSIVYEVLARFGRAPDFDAIRSFEAKDHFRCFPLESNPSISANIHVLGALRQAGFEGQHPYVQKVLSFLRGQRIDDAFWYDKWHVSPYYASSHAIIACLSYDPSLAASAARWMIDTQNPDGSWGYYIPTAEETAYCLQALALCKQDGYEIPGNVLERGAAWLASHRGPPYPMLWIGKSLYCPHHVVTSAILSALTLCQIRERIRP